MMADLVVKATVLLAMGWIAALVLRGRAASTRHAVWAGLLTATLMLPLVAAFVPAIELPLLSAEAAATAPNQITPVREVAIFTDVPGNSGESRVRIDAAPATAPNALAWYASLTPTQIVLGAWLAVALLLALRVAAAHLQVRGLLRACGDPSERLHDAIAGVSSALGIRTPSLRIAPAGMMPAVVGLTRPSVVLPADAEAWSAERLELVLMHECAHVRRRDTLMQIISSLATSAYWWHPLAWIAARQVVRERELACDDLVIASGTPAERYAEHLIDIARSMKASRQPSLAALAMARPSQLEGRLIALLDERPRGSRPVRSLAAGLALAILAGVTIAPLKVVAKSVVAPMVGEAGPRGDVQLPAVPGASAPVADRMPQTSAATPAPEPQANPALSAAFLKAMSDEDADVRALAAAALAQSGGDQTNVVAALLKALNDSSEDVRRNALAGLVRLEAREVIPHLAAILKDESEDVRTIAVIGLEKFDHPEKRALLLQTAGDASEDVRSLVAFALAGEGGDDVAAMLTKMAADGSADVRAAAIMALASQKRAGSAQLLRDALKDTHHDVRAAAAIALGALDDKGSIDALTAAMSDPNADVRRSATAAAASIAGDWQATTTVASTLAGTIAGTIHGTLWGGSGYVWAGPLSSAAAPKQDPAPRKKVVTVMGEVKQPGSFDWEDGLSVGKAIAMAGGVTARGTMARIRIMRLKDGEYVQITASAKTEDVLQPDDRVIVPQRRF